MSTHTRNVTTYQAPGTWQRITLCTQCVYRLGTTGAWPKTDRGIEYSDVYQGARHGMCDLHPQAVVEAVTAMLGELPCPDGVELSARVAEDLIVVRIQARKGADVPFDRWEQIEESINLTPWHFEHVGSGPLDGPFIDGAEYAGGTYQQWTAATSRG